MNDGTLQTGLYDSLRETGEMFQPADADGNPVEQWERVRYSGGSENITGEKTGETESREAFQAKVWDYETDISEREGATDIAGELRLKLMSIGFLEENDLVEHVESGRAYRVTDVTDLGGTDRDIGSVASLSLQHSGGH